MLSVTLGALIGTTRKRNDVSGGGRPTPTTPSHAGLLPAKEPSLKFKKNRKLKKNYYLKNKVETYNPRVEDILVPLRSSQKRTTELSAVPSSVGKTLLKSFSVVNL